MVGQGSVMQAILLGIVQGLTEFLPVSSSGHLVLARAVMDIPELPMLFDVLLHVATLAAVCFYFRRLIGELIGVCVRLVTRTSRIEDTPSIKLMIAMIGATVATVAVVLLFKAIGFGDYGVRGVSIAMFVTAIALASTLLVSGSKTFADFSLKTIIVTGIAQGFGTLTGISRSGITLTASLWCKLDRKTAGDYTFMLSIPAILGALVLALFEDAPAAAQWFSSTEIAIGCVIAAVVGFFSLKLLLWMIRKARLWYFSVYLVVAGTIGLLVLA